MRFSKSELNRNQFLNTLFYLIYPPCWINLYLQPWISIILILDYIIKIKASTTFQLPTVNIDYILTKLSINSLISEPNIQLLQQMYIFGLSLNLQTRELSLL